jgi:hypothetical protein
MHHSRREKAQSGMAVSLYQAKNSWEKEPASCRPEAFGKTLPVFQSLEVAFWTDKVPSTREVGPSTPAVRFSRSTIICTRACDAKSRALDSPGRRR